MEFLKRLFSSQKSEDKHANTNFIVATINDKVMPIDRGELYEDPLDEFIQTKGIGSVTGGGTMSLATHEIDYCDVEILMKSDKITDEQIELIITKLEELGAPKGSKLTIEKTKKTFKFGRKEGLAIYLDGKTLSPEVYKTSDVNVVVSEIQQLTGDTSEIIRYWEGGEETALYFYSDSFSKMKEAIAGFVADYPLCKGARIERIA